MNISNLREFLSRMDEIKVIGRKASINDIMVHVMGVVRYGTEIRLLILQYDEAFQNGVDEAEEEGLLKITNKIESNRMFLRRNWERNGPDAFHAVSKISFGDQEFEVKSAEQRRLNVQHWECILLFSEFLHRGWKPDGIEYQRIDMLFLTSLEMKGQYSIIPALEGNVIRFTRQPESVTYLSEQPITLTVGGEYPEKFRFRNENSGEEHWAQINRVYLSDMWAEMENNFNSPKIREHMTPEQITRARTEFEERFLHICPKGMYFPIVEYECEENIFLQFHSKSYLAAQPEERNWGMVFMLSPEQSTGILGMKLKSAVIQEPFTAETQIIEAELFQYNHNITGEDIVIQLND
jgi:hypothetical protein